MQTKLSDISEIISGYSFRGAVPLDSSSELRAVQVKDIDEYGDVNYTTLSPIAEENIRTDAYLQHDDIILSSRGTESSSIKVGLYTGTNGKAVATSSLYILRITQKAVEPKYLLHYLRSLSGQRALKNIMAGATVQSIPKKELSSLFIPIPSKQKQQLIIDTIGNLTSQTQLHIQKIHHLQTLANNIISI